MIEKDLDAMAGEITKQSVNDAYNQRVQEVLIENKDKSKKEIFEILTKLGMLNVHEISDNQIKDNGEVFNVDGKFSASALANAVVSETPIITTKDNEMMYYYEQGIYHPDKNAVIIKEVARKLKDNITKHQLNEVIEYIKNKTYTSRDLFNNHEHLIWVKNGILDINSGELLEFTPKLISTIRLPVEYNKNADPKPIVDFISDVVVEGDVKLIQELFGYFLIKSYPKEKSFMLFGSGENGKSTFLNLIHKFLGDENIANISLQALCYERFAKAGLYGKLANINADLPSTAIKSTGNFKEATGNDMIRADVKNKDPFKFRNFAKMVFACNQLPATSDNTDAFFRRWEIITFPYKFTDDKNDIFKQKDVEVLKKISSEQNLSGLLNWALEGLKRFRKQGFTSSKIMKDIKDEWILRTNMLQAFVNRYVEEGMGYYVPKEVFYEAYVEFCKEHDLEAEKSHVVSRNLKSVIPRVRDERPKIEGKQVRVWKGIGISNDILSIYPSYPAIFLLSEIKSNIIYGSECSHIHGYNGFLLHEVVTTCNNCKKYKKDKFWIKKDKSGKIINKLCNDCYEKQRSDKDGI